VRILVLGAAGFVGSNLLSRLCHSSVETGRSSTTTIVASDIRKPVSGWPRNYGGDVAFVEGDITNAMFTAQLFSKPVDCVFHLAAALTLDAEMDFGRGLDINVHSLMRLLEHCRAQAQPPTFIFASSISSFGGPLPAVVDDYVFQTPQTSYGAHKVIAEQLINDYSRRGYVDGRVLRFPVVLTHPGPATASVSDRIASLIREPLSGRNTVCALRRDTPIAVVSVEKIVDSLLKLCQLPSGVFKDTRAMNQPALTVTPAEIVAGVERVAAERTGMPHGSVTWAPDAQMQRIVDGWPSNFTSSLALQNGITADKSVNAMIDAYLSAKE